jgi:5'-nucleotidase
MPRSFRVGTGVAVCTAGALLFAPLIATPAFAAPSESVVISEVYAHGGNTDAGVNSKYVELYNPTDADISLDGWSLQYRSATGDSALTNIVRPTGTIEAGGHYLVATGVNNGGQGGAALPAGDPVDGSINIGGAGGTVFLVDGTEGLPIAGRTTGLENATDLGIVDFVGWGTAKTFEAVVAPGVSDAKSISRPGADTDVNGTDFVQSDPTPTNSAGETLGAEQPEPTPEPSSPVDPSPEPSEPSEPAEPGIRSIAEIQGTGAESPLAGETVTTEGVVVGSFLEDRDEAGLHIQTAGTGGAAGEASHGVFVQWPENQAPDVAQLEVGDAVRVTGAVREQFGVTKVQLSDPAAQVEDLGKGELPTVTELAWPLGDEELERYESMLVQPVGAMTVTNVFDTNTYGEVALTPGDEPILNPTTAGDVGSPAHQRQLELLDAVLVLDDARGFDYRNAATDVPLPYLSRQAPARVGASATVTGGSVLGYAFGTWRLQPSKGTEVPVAFDASRETAPRPVAGDVKIGTFNVLNYFTRTAADEGCTDVYRDRAGAPITARGCDVRGAADDANLDRQAAKIVAAIRGLGAHVVALEEIENSAKFGADRDEAVADLVRRLNLAEGSEVWAYAASPQARPAIGDEDVIRNAFIYRADVVETVGESLMLIGDPYFSNAREPLAQWFRPLDGSSEQEFLVASNHFKSKGGSDDETSGDNRDDGEGYYSGDRTRQAASLTEWVASFTDDEDRVFLVGDFNSYAMEAPIDVIRAAGYTDIGARTGEQTYTFDGAVGSLDYVFANTAAAETVVGADIWNINSVESPAFEYSRYNTNVSQLYAPDVFRSSDHDPVLVGLALTDTTTVQVLGINDFHGRLEANPGGGVAGAAVLAGAVDKFRAGNRSTLFVSAGDSIGGSTFTSFSQDDQPTIDALHAAGLDLSAVGNHEFDRGFADLRDRVIPGYGGADFALGANVYDEATGKPALKEYAIRTVDGVDVAFIGTVTEQTASAVSPAGIEGLVFGDQVEAVNRVAEEIEQADSADVIMLLTHEGAGTADCDTMATTGDDFAAIVNNVTPSVDAIISAHTHQQYECWIAPEGGEERPVLQTGEYGGALDRLEFDVDRTSGELLDVRAEIVPLVDRTATRALFPADREVAAIVAEAVAAAEEIGGQEIGSITGDITRAKLPNGDDDRGAESALGNLIADIQLWATSESPEFGGSVDSDIAIMNPGGVRDDLLFGEDGTVTYREVANVQPFANSLFTMDLTGEQLIQVLEEQWQPAGASRPFLNLGLSANVDYTYDPTAAAGSRVVSVSVDGEQLGTDDVIRVTTNSFLASGGDNFGTLAEGAARADTGIVDLAAAVSYFEAVDPVEPAALGRGTVVDGSEPGNPGNPGGPGNPGAPGAEQPGAAPAPAPAASLTSTLENRITSDDRSLSAGQTIRIFVGEQYAGDWVQVWLYSTPVLVSDGWVQVDPAGYVTIELPDELPAGAHRLAVLDADGNVIGWQSVTVADTGLAGLADTGAQVAPVLVFGALMLAAGAVLVIARRRAAQA